jgi:hypothetical protein
MGITSDCGQGSHAPVCPGYGTDRYYEPELDNGVEFPCSCGCHYVPSSLGIVTIRPDQVAAGEVLPPPPPSMAVMVAEEAAEDNPGPMSESS